ncbi:MAG: TrmH family RNA methyltransferase [Thermaurantimonas sp.]
MDEQLDLQYFDRLFDLLTEHKKSLFAQIVKQRTNHIAWLTDNLYHEQNSSAIVRTADCFGYNKVFILEDKYHYKVNKEIAMGAQKWVIHHTIHVEANRYTSAVQKIKDLGYRLIAASHHSKETTLENLDISSPLCIALGSERHGLHQDIMESADGFVHIPMMGFTESLNVSVTAGILMYGLRKRLESEVTMWQLTPMEEKETIFQWMLKTIPNASKMIQRWNEDESVRMQ